MKIFVNDPDKLRLVFPCSVAQANAIRRTLLGDLITWAVDRVLVEQNTSAMQDKLLAHRLSMLPITAPLHLPQDEIHFKSVLDVGTVNVEDTHFQLDDDQLDAQGIRFGHGGTVVCTLARGEVLQVTAVAVRGTGALHAKWCAVTRATFEETAEGMLFTVETAENIRAQDAFLQALQRLSVRTSKMRI